MFFKDLDLASLSQTPRLSGFIYLTESQTLQASSSDSSQKNDDSSCDPPHVHHLAHRGPYTIR
jgi:hypothetical protein